MENGQLLTFAILITLHACLSMFFGHNYYLYDDVILLITLHACLSMFFGHNYYLYDDVIVL